MKNKNADQKRAEQLFGSNRTIDVSDKRFLEVVEFEDVRRDIELDRLRQELDEILKDTEVIFELSRSKTIKSIEKSHSQLMRDYLRKLRKNSD